MLPFILLLVLLIVVMLGTAYASVLVTKAPINLPFVEAVVYKPNIPDNTENVMEQWRNRTIYEPEVVYDKVEDIIKDETVEVDEINDTEFLAEFNAVDKVSFDDYITKNPDVLENGYEKMLIDKVDLLNTPTGIKTTKGDDVLAIDAMDGIVIIGIDVPSDTGTSKVKLAIVNNKDQLDMSLVKDLSYWSIVEDHAVDNRAILAVNASSYNWNDTGGYATLYGAMKYHGDLIRKAVENEAVITLSEDGTLEIAGNLDTAYNAFEVSPTLIKDGIKVYESPENESRYAMSAIGQTADGKTLILTASGGIHGSNLGVTPSEVMAIMEKYGAHNAVSLSGGSRTMMYWNGRNVTEAVGYPTFGMRLPNAIIVKPAALIDRE